MIERYRYVRSSLTPGRKIGQRCFDSFQRWFNATMPTRCYIVEGRVERFIYIWVAKIYIGGTFITEVRLLEEEGRSIYIRYGFTIVNYLRRSKQVLDRSLMFLFEDEKVVHEFCSILISMEIFSWNWVKINVIFITFV